MPSGTDHDHKATETKFPAFPVVSIGQRLAGGEALPAIEGVGHSEPDRVAERIDFSISESAESDRSNLRTFDVRVRLSEPKRSKDTSVERLQSDYNSTVGGLDN